MLITKRHRALFLLCKKAISSNFIATGEKVLKNLMNLTAYMSERLGCFMIPVPYCFIFVRYYNNQTSMSSFQCD